MTVNPEDYGIYKQWLPGWDTDLIGMIVSKQSLSKHVKNFNSDRIKCNKND